MAMSDETKRKISEAKKRYYQEHPEAAAAHAERMKGRRRTAEEKQRISATMKQKYIDDEEYRTRLQQHNARISRERALTWSDERKEAFRESIRESWRRRKEQGDVSVGQKISLSLLKAYATNPDLRKMRSVKQSNEHIEKRIAKRAETIERKRVERAQYVQKNLIQEGKWYTRADFDDLYRTLGVMTNDIE